MKTRETIVVLGAGAWGSALATVLAKNGHPVLLWAYERAVADEINQHHTNKRYAPHVQFDQTIQATIDITAAIGASKFLVCAIPVMAIRSAMTPARAAITDDHFWISTSKGLENTTLLLPTDLIVDVVQMPVKTAVLAGPSFAREVIEQQPTAMVCASQERDRAAVIAQLFANNFLHIELSTDVAGVQIGGILKNVIALACGMLEGAGFKDNARAMLVTRGLTEMFELARHFGGNPATINGFAGVGDLVLTATSSESRNFRAGILLGQGSAIDQIKQQFGTLPEGFNSVSSLHTLIQRFGLRLPIVAATYACLFEKGDVRDLLAMSKIF